MNQIATMTPSFLAQARLEIRRILTDRRCEQAAREVAWQAEGEAKRKAQRQRSREEQVGVIRDLMTDLLTGTGA